MVPPPTAPPKKPSRRRLAPVVGLTPIAPPRKKKAAEQKYYAVKEGKRPGIYHTWSDCLAQVKGHKGAEFKAFQSLHEAQAFMQGRPLLNGHDNGLQRFYGVQSGRVPGVYTDWSQVQAQIRGFPHARQKKFRTREEAEVFVAAGAKASVSGSQRAGAPQADIRQLVARKSAPGLQDTVMGSATDQDANPDEISRGFGDEDKYDTNIRVGPGNTIINRAEEEQIRAKVKSEQQESPGMLRIYTDGSALGNGAPGAKAGVGVFFGPQNPLYATSPSKPNSQYKPQPTRYTVSKKPQIVYTMDWAARQLGSGDGQAKKRLAGEMDDDKTRTRKAKLTDWRYRNVSETLEGDKQTNQRAELTAILRALDIAPRHREVTIYTDSRYAIDCVTNWYRNWIKNGWVNSKGIAVVNKDVVQRIRDRIEERERLGKRTLFVWVKGHSNDPGNVAADHLAVQAAMRANAALPASAALPEINNAGDSSDSSDFGEYSVAEEDDDAAFQSMVDYGR
ncbi:hypothetical protein AYL99_08605 [Fonsecaea erecta]|uniref:Ribonuclease H n=1 Tax=Fonsecaea erecta TaxID=1367422 RepID=A0A178ZDK9_9EURO|nr:hypothetical protein AYL99_08605 [Fonsecaea erecta]OAP57867.1 hypothetical protein AYL99_08605 [Fonsecaea erecta]